MGGQNPSKIWRDFAQLHTSITNISGTDEDIDKRKTALSTTVPPTSDQKNRMNFGPLTDEFICRVSTHPKSNYSNDYISAPRGRCRLKFLHALENDQGFLPHTPLRMRSPKQFFITKIQKWLKIQHTHAYNFGARGRNPTKLSHVTCHEAGMIMCAQILWGHAPQKFGRAKTYKIRRDFGQLWTLTANISSVDRDIKNRKQT